MANSLIASDKGLQLVNDAREKQGWQRTDKRFLAAAGEISRATSIALSGEWLFFGSDDNTIKQWSIATGKCVATFYNSLCAGANITGVRGLTEAQITSLQTLGAISDDLGIN
jgi:WD40 repeat protein